VTFPQGDQHHFPQIVGEKSKSGRLSFESKRSTKKAKSNFSRQRKVNFPPHIFPFLCLFISRDILAGFGECSRRALADLSSLYSKGVLPMRDSVDMDGIHDVRSRRAFFDREIVRRNPILEMELEFTPNFSLSETRAVCGPLFGITFGHICSLTFLSTSSVALFRGSDSESTNGVCFVTSWQAHKIMAPEAPHSHAAFLSIRPDAYWINEWRLSFANASSEGERYMTDTDHPARHPSVHRQILGRVRRRRSCAWHDDQFGRGQNTGLGWSDPTFVHVSVPKVIRGVAPAQLRGDRAEYFVGAAFHSRGPQ
jgi:hypothetical protein